MKTVNTVVHDINTMLTNVINGVGVDIPGEALADFGISVALKVSEALQPRTYVRPEKTIRASEVGKPCVRAIWYGYHMPTIAEPIYPALKVKFLYGDILEELVLLLTTAAGHKVADRQREKRIDLGNGWTLLGHIDGTVDGVVVDVKSASGFGFEKFVEGLNDSNDSFGYRAQLSVYTDQPEAGFLVINKENGAITYSQAGVQEYDIEARIGTIINALEQATPPAREFEDVIEGKGGNKKLCTNCSYCGYKVECWKDANDGAGLRKFLYSNKPVYLTVVGTLPKVLEVSL